MSISLFTWRFSNLNGIHKLPISSIYFQGYYLTWSRDKTRHACKKKESFAWSLIKIPWAFFALARLQSTVVVVTNSTIILVSRESQLISQHFRARSHRYQCRQSRYTHICNFPNLNLTKALRATVITLLC